MSEKRGFEASLSELEQCVRKLEAGDLPLDESLKLFEEGVSLARACHEQLEAAERRVAALTQGNERIVEQELAEPES